MKKPVAVIIYNRSKYLSQLIESIREYKPKKVYIIGDGWKNNQDKMNVLTTRKFIENNIDWNCKIVKFYSEKNLGLRRRVVSGLNMVFEIEESVIILEDDLVVDPSFYTFCEELLEKYKKNEKISCISGNNFQFGEYLPSQSYFFSRYVHSWGWATWARAWKKYDDDLIYLKTMKDKHILRDILDGMIKEWYWLTIFYLVKKNKFDSWAYRWSYSNFYYQALSISPSQNLVSNLGYGRGATNTRLKNKVMNLPTFKVKFPLSHPRSISADIKADNNTFRNLYFRPRGLIGLIYIAFFGKTFHE